jgi:hypothetical protein
MFIKFFIKNNDKVIQIVNYCINFVKNYQKVSTDIAEIHPATYGNRKSETTNKNRLVRIFLFLPIHY